MIALGFGCGGKSWPWVQFKGTQPTGGNGGAGLVSITALLNLAGAERARPGKANGSPERRVRGLGLAGVAEPFGRLSQENAGEGRPWLPTEYACLWLYRCTSLLRLIIMVHAVNKCN